MKPFRFVHAADLHLDSPFKGLSEVAPSLQSIMREATFRAVQAIVDLCLKREVNFLVIAGDIYDAADRSLRGLVRLRQQFECLAERAIPVFLCHGNHDPLSGWGARFGWPDTVHVFGAGGVESKPVLQKGWELARVYGISYDQERVEANLAKDFHRENSAPWAIGLLHTNVGNNPNHLNYAPCEVKDLLNAKMDYWALGHVHTRTILNPEHPVVLYPGNPQGRHRREPGARGCYLVEVSETGQIQYEFVPVDVVRWHEEPVHIEGLRDMEELLSQCDDRIHELKRVNSGRALIVRWRLEGRSPLHREFTKPGRVEDIVATLRDKWGTGTAFVWTDSLIDGTSRDVDLEALRQEENLLGDFLRLAGNPDEELLQESRKELNLLFDDPRAHRYLDSPDDDQIRRWLHQAEQMGVDRLLANDDF